MIRVHIQGFSANIKNSLNFMIFRTGSILIVGKASDEDLYEVYDLLKVILIDNHSSIREEISNNSNVSNSEITNKSIKIKKRYIYV